MGDGRQRRIEGIEFVGVERGTGEVVLATGKAPATLFPGEPGRVSALSVPDMEAVTAQIDDQILHAALDAGRGGCGKYESYGGPSLARIARLLTSYGAEPDVELLRLLERVTFTVTIGDADAHGKNISLLHPTAEHVSLAPCTTRSPRHCGRNGDLPPLCTSTAGPC
jgi:hypothetical protein